MINRDVIELGKQYGIQEKHSKLLVLCAILLLIKFLVMPVIEWQMEIKEDSDFYQMQLRDKDSLDQGIALTEQNLLKVEQELAKIGQYYYQGTATENQVKLTGLVSAKIDELSLSLASNNVRAMQPKNGVQILEYSFEVRGTAEPLAEFIYWLETLEPQLLVKSMGFTSVRRSPRTTANLRVHQLLSVEQ